MFEIWLLTKSHEGKRAYPPAFFRRRALQIRLCLCVSKTMQRYEIRKAQLTVSNGF